MVFALGLAFVVDDRADESLPNAVRERDVKAHFPIGTQVVIDRYANRSR